MNWAAADTKALLDWASLSTDEGFAYAAGASFV
jgi:hypothetical protein